MKNHEKNHGYLMDEGFREAAKTIAIAMNVFERKTNRELVF